MEQDLPAVGAPVEPTVRPCALADDKVMAGHVGNCASDAAKNYWLRSNQFDRMMAERLTHPLYALPPELAEYLLHHLRQERAALDGFLRLGNEKPRAKRLDAWIACLAGPNFIARALRSMFLRDMRKRAADLAEDAGEAQKLLQHGSRATTVRHYRTKAERLKPAR